jgi:hypothetical protein
MHRCPCVSNDGVRCINKTDSGVCVKHVPALSKHIHQHEYARKLKSVPGYNDIVFRQLFIKYETEEMKKKEDILNEYEEILNMEALHKERKERHSQFINEKAIELDIRRQELRSK